MSLHPVAFKMRHLQKFSAFLPPLILTGVLLWFYFSTLAPGLTWANYGSDGGDLVTAAATGGIPHPSGYPLYLLLARAFQFLPIGTLAFRTNLLSLVAATLTAWLVYELIARSENPWAGLASALTFGLAPLVWSQAVITEVYALHILFVAVIVSLSSGILSTRFTSRQLDFALGLTFGLSLGNHVTTFLLLPLLFVNLPERPERMDAILRRLAWMLGSAALLYLTLPLRAIFNPPVNWYDPVTPGRFLSLITGSLYRGKLLALTPLAVWDRLRSTAGLLLEQGGLVGLLLAALGLVVFSKPTPLYRATLWTAASSLAFALLYGTHDSFVYLLPVCLAFAIWVGTGLSGLMQVLRGYSSHFAPVLGAALILLLMFLAWTHRPLVDASHDTRAEVFGQEVLSQAPENAIIFAAGDRALFSLWYFHFALKERPDVAIVSKELLGFDWYQESLGQTYPDLQLPGPLAFAERMAALNPERPTCMVEFIQSATIECSP